MSQRHSGSRLGKLAAFRSRLLQFVLLLTHRYHPTQTWTNEESLQRLQEQNHARGKLWATLHDTTKERRRPSWLSVMGSADREQRIKLLQLPFSDTRQFTDPDRPLLEHLLPLFIELTAARANLGDEWRPTSDWFDLAGQFMLQTVVDHYTCHDQCDKATFNSIFAFGNPGPKTDGEESDVTAMRSLFCTEDVPQKELPEWTAIRRKYVREVRTVGESRRV